MGGRAHNLEDCSREPPSRVNVSWDRTFPNMLEIWGRGVWGGVFLLNLSPCTGEKDDFSPFTRASFVSTTLVSA